MKLLNFAEEKNLKLKKKKFVIGSEVEFGVLTVEVLLLGELVGADDGAWLAVSSNLTLLVP